MRPSSSRLGQIAPRADSRWRCWSGSSLRDAVTHLVDKVFQAGTADSLIQYIRGHLTSEIRDKGEASNTLDGFLEEVGTLSVMVSVEGSIKRFLEKYSAAAQYIPSPGSIVWARLPEEPEERMAHRRACP